MSKEQAADNARLVAALEAHPWETYGVLAGDVFDGIRVYGPFVTWLEATYAADELGGQAFTLMGRDITRGY